MNLEEDFNPATSFLQQTDEQDPIRLFQAYARHLLDSSSSWTLPVPLDRIRSRHGFQLRKAPIPQRGFLFGDTIFVNADDRETVQSFSQAHEMMETLVGALRAETPARFSKTVWRTFDQEKERWCEIGAAEVVMPAKLFFPLVEQHGVSFQVGRQLATLCHTSLIATIRRILDADAGACIFILLREGHKKNQIVPSKTGQGVLWGTSTDWDPPAELRVWRYWSSPRVDVRLCPNESVSRQTTVYKTLQDGIVGQVRVGLDVLDLEYIKGPKHTESMLVTIDGAPVIMTLIHL